MMHWIPIETATPRKAEVLKMAAILKISRGDAFTICVDFWIWAQDQSIDGKIELNVDACETACGVAVGALRAMVEVGWLEDKGDHVVIPRWDRLLSKGSKSRIQKTLRQRKWRISGDGQGENEDANVDASNASKVRPEKRREEKSIKARARQGVQGENIDALASHGRTGLEKTVVALWPGELPSGGIPRVEALARSFSELGATPETLRAAKAAADKAWSSPGGPDALLKHYGSFHPKTPPTAVNAYQPPSAEAQERLYRLHDEDMKRRQEYAAKNGAPAVVPPAKKGRGKK